MKTSDGPKYSDLTARTATGVALALLGLGAIWAGGIWFSALVAVAVGLMIWEMGRLTGLDALPQMSVSVAVLAGALFFIVAWTEIDHREVWLVFPTLLGLGVLYARRHDPKPPGIWRWVGGSLAVMLAAYVAVTLREGGGVVWILWLVLTVVVTDVGGYFAGRAIGGRKFWPSVSPKKTWAGVLAGWLGAGVVGAAFMPLTNTGEGLILVSMALSFASQMGDIGESALKRRAGVKDSSNLLPGHGGLLDRLDGVIGALLVTGFVALLTNYPEAPI